MKTKVKKVVKIFSWLVALSAVFAPVSCDNPVSLGGAIDASVPVVSINKELGPGPNAFIFDTTSIYINASDDQGIKSVTATYTYSVPGPDGKPAVQPAVTVPARWDNGSGNYVLDIDTKRVKNPYAAVPEYIPMADGALLAAIVVEDRSGKKTVSPELVYTVKNNPPDITMQIPRPKTMNTRELKNDDPSQPLADFPGVVTNNYIMGVFEDLAGVAAGYPQIKFWPAADPEPGANGSGDKANAGWNPVTTFDNDPNDGWIDPDEGRVTSAKGERAGSFRYYLRERKPDGKPWAEEDNKALHAGLYKLKIRAGDINGIPVEWPRDFYDNAPDSMTVKLLASGTPPVVTILKPVELYQRTDFAIEAKAALAAEDTLNTAIAGFSLEVAGKTKKNPNESKPVTLAIWNIPGSDKETPVQDFTIKPGKTYYQLTGELKARGPFDNPIIPDTVEGKTVESYITFTDGNFNFTVRAEGDSGMSGSRLLSLYIDRSPPAVSVTSVSPYFTQDDPSLSSGTDKPNHNVHDKTDGSGKGIPDPYRRWTVNSTIKIGVNSTDTRGNAVDPLNNGYMKFKYLLLTDGDIAQAAFETWRGNDSTKTFGEYLYTHPKAMFFDHRKANPLDSGSPLWEGPINGNPLSAVTGEDGAYTLSLQTHHYKDNNASVGKYLVWFYIVSRDNAGTVNYDKILLNVDEDTDIPVVEFGNLNKEGHPHGLTFADETLNIRINVSDDDGLTAAAAEYRFQTDVSDNSTWSHGTNASSWYPLSADPSADSRTILIKDLSLTKIACDLIGHPHDRAHTMDAVHRAALGSELKTKGIEVRAYDDVNKKVYPGTDEKVYGKTGRQKFTMDLTSPLIKISILDMAGAGLSPPRTSEDPFGAPRKDEAFTTAFTAYGDFLERNFRSFAVIIDGGENIEIPLFVVPASIPDADPGTGHAAVRKAPSSLWAGSSWDGELRWRFSLASTDFKKKGVKVTDGSSIWDNLSDGSHTFMIQFTDNVPRTTVKQLTFFKDSEGPAINFVTINGTRLTDVEAAAIKGGGALDTDTKAKYDAVKDGATIKEADAKIAGTFVDGYSAVADAFWYKINNGPWLSKPTDSASTGKAANWTIDVKNLSDGFHTLSIRAKDSGGSGYDDTSVNPPNGPGAETNIGFIMDRKDPALLIVSPYADKDTVETVYAYKTAGITPTTNVITLKGLAGDSSFRSGSPVLAAIDNNPAVDTYITTQSLNWRGSFVSAPTSPAPLKWDAYHDNLLNKYFIRNGNSWDELGGVPPGSTAYDPVEGEKTLLWTFSLDAQGFDNVISTEGIHKITVSTEDSTNRKAARVWNFVWDNTPPVINIINGAPGNGETNPVIIMDGANPKIQGTVSDLHGKVSKLEVKMEKKTAGTWGTIQVSGQDWEGLTISNGSWEKASASGDGQYRITVRAYDDARAAGNLQTLAPLYFVVDTAPPVLSELLALPFRNRDFTLAGTVTDANTVTISAAMDGAPITSGITQPDGSGNWALAVQVKPAEPGWEKSHTVTITATDKAGRTDTKVYNFTYDKTAPGASIAAPSPGRHNPATDAGNLSDGRWAFYDSGVWINGVTDVRGTSDDKNGVTKIYYHLGKLTSDTEAVYNAASWTDTLLDTGTPHSGWTGGLYSWTFTDNFNAYGSVPGMIIGNTDDPNTPENEDTPNDFYLPLYIKITDAAGNRRVLHYNLWVDPDLDKPQVGIATPASNSVVGGEVRISGTASDDDWVYGVQIRIKNGSRYYKNTGDTFIYGGSPAPGNEGWVWAHIVGNTSTTVAWYYIINGDGALNPAMGTMTQVEIEARAVDTQDDLHATPMITGSPDKITVKFDSNVPTVNDVLMSRDNGTTWEALTAGVRAGGTFILRAAVRDEGGISGIRARETGDAAYQDMLANPKPGQWAVEKPAAIEGNLWIPGYKYFITTVGAGGDSALNNNWDQIDAEWTSSKKYDAGTTFQYKPGAPTFSGTGWFAQKAEGSQGTISDTSNPGYAAQYDGQYFEYIIKVTVDSTAAAYYPYGKTGNYSLELQVTDNNAVPAPYMTMVTYNVMVDNYYPTARFTTQYNASTNSFYVSGTAQDYDGNSGSIQGLERVLVYFQRGANYMNAAGAVFSGSPAYAQGKEGNAAANSAPTGIKNFPVMTLDSGVWKSGHAMVIDRQEFNGDIDQDGTYDEVFQDKGTVKEWAARFDTTKLSDGPITVHYVIMDLAGNAAHYTQDIYIRNNPPIIREFNLGTDLDGNGAIDPWELNEKSFIVAAVSNNNTPADESDDTASIVSSMTKAIQTGFTVRNNQLRFDLNTFGGNGQKHYRVSYVTANTTPVNSTALSAGEVYTISAANPGNTDWTSLGAPNNNSGTTFVAAGPASAWREDGTTPTTGKAISYTGIWAKADGFAADGNRPSGYSDRAQTLFSGAGDFARIPDSIVGNTSALTHDRFFIIKVYDTTVQAGAENQQLAYAVLLNLDTDNADESPPAAKVIPFYWNGASDNSIYKNSGNNGHIELEDDLPGAFSGTTGIMDKDPKVSGQISIRGTAYDNGKLDSLWVYLDGFDFSFPGAVTTGVGSPSRQYVKAAVYAGGGKWDGIDRWGDKGWTFTVNTGAGSGHVHDQTGHRVNWRLDIDTAKIAGVAAADRVFRILARDGAPNDSAESGNQTAANQTPYYRMDVVPYITEVETRLSAFNRSAPSVYVRTALGRYVAAENDPLTVYGFNFGAGPKITLGKSSFTGAQLTLGRGAGSRSSWQSAKINNIGSSVKSGPLALTTNGLSSLNNENSNNAEINQQPNLVNNNTLTDDVEIDIWQFTEVFKSRSETRYPAMKVGPQGQIGFSFANDYRWFNMPGYLYGTNTTDDKNFYSQSLYQNGWGGYSYNTFAFDPRGNTYGAAINIDESSVKQSANFSFFYRVPSANPSNMANQDSYEGTRFNSVRLENTTLPLADGNANASGQSYIVDINRIQNPQIVTSMADPGADVSDTNKVNVYMAYYDRITKQIRFRSGSIGGNRTNTMGADFRASFRGTTFTAYNDTGNTTISHGLTVNTPVYVRCSTNTSQDKSVQYYVHTVPSTTTFTLKASLSGKAPTVFSANSNYTVSVVEGGFGDLTGYITDGGNSRVNYLDADPRHYQTVAAGGEYLPGKTVTYIIPGSNTTRSTTYPRAAGHKPSQHLALGVVPGTRSGTSDVAVIAWYDSTMGELVFSYNDDPKNDGSEYKWQNNVKTVDTNAGEYVSMAVDADGGIHLAYYSSNGADLKYAYASSYNGSFTSVLVDAYQSVGTYASITAGKLNIAAPSAPPDWRIVPAISYYASGGGSSLAAKTAYRDYGVVSSGGPAVAGVNERDMYTGAWEVSTVPTKNSVLEYQISVGAYVDGSGKLQPIPSNPSGTVVNGPAYGAGDAASINGPTRVYGNGTLNPVVGYGTTANLEMAQKK